MQAIYRGVFRQQEVPAHLEQLLELFLRSKKGAIPPLLSIHQRTAAPNPNPSLNDLTSHQPIRKTGIQSLTNLQREHS